MENNSTITVEWTQNDAETLIKDGLTIFDGAIDDTKTKLIELYGDIKGTESFNLLKNSKLLGVDIAFSWDKNKSTDENIANISGNYLQGAILGGAIVAGSGSLLLAASGTVIISNLLKENGIELGNYTESIYKDMKVFFAESELINLSDQINLAVMAKENGTAWYEEINGREVIGLAGLLDTQKKIHSLYENNEISDRLYDQLMGNITDYSINGVGSTSQYSQYSDMYYDSFVAPTIGAFYESTSNPQNDTSESIADKTGVILDSNNNAVSERGLEGQDANNDGKLSGKELNSLNLWTELPPYHLNIVVNNADALNKKHLEMGTFILISFKLAS